MRLVVAALTDVQSLYYGKNTARDRNTRSAVADERKRHSSKRYELDHAAYRQEYLEYVCDRKSECHKLKERILELHRYVHEHNKT